MLERRAKILPTTRAVVYQPVVIPALKELGILEAVIKNAYLNHDGIYWRDADGQELARLPIGSGKQPGQSSHSAEGFDGVLLLGQQRLAELILKELSKHPSVTIRWNSSIVGFTHEDPDSVRVAARDRQSQSEIKFRSNWLLGTDGANSAVRQAAGIPFEGFTYPSFKMIGVDVWHDFQRSNGFKPMNFVVHPDKWAVVIYCGQDQNGDPYGKGIPLWRVAFAVPPGTSEDREYLIRLSKDRIAGYASGLQAGDVHISRAEPYHMQQRCAQQARKGRVLLAGDALHSNNPIGGLGLTSGIIDAASYGNALARVIKDGEAESLVTACAESRRRAWLEVTNPASQINVRRLRASDEDAVKEREHFFYSLNTDPDFAKQQLAWLRKIGENMLLPHEAPKAGL